MRLFCTFSTTMQFKTFFLTCWKPLVVATAVSLQNPEALDPDPERVACISHFECLVDAFAESVPLTKDSIFGFAGVVIWEVGEVVESDFPCLLKSPWLYYSKMSHEQFSWRGSCWKNVISGFDYSRHTQEYCTSYYTALIIYWRFLN